MESKVIELSDRYGVFSSQDVIVFGDWSETFYEKALQLSDFIKGLPIDRETNERLVLLMVECLKSAHGDGIRDGYGLGYDIRTSEQAIETALKKGAKNYE